MTRAMKRTSTEAKDKMRWKTEKEGTTRTRTVFAWYPLEADDGFTYWLEKVVVEETLKLCGGFDDPPFLQWRTLSTRKLQPNVD